MSRAVPQRSLPPCGALRGRERCGTHLRISLALKRYAGLPQHDADRLLPEALFVSIGNLIEARHVLGVAGEHDHHHLARLTHDPVAPAVAILAPGIVDGETVGKARRDLAVEEIQKLRLAHPETIAGLAAKQQLRHLLGLE